MTPAVPAAGPAAFPHTITVVNRNTIMLKELSRIFEMSPKRLKQLKRDEGFPLKTLGANGPIYSTMKLVDAWFEKHAKAQCEKAVK